ncbi:DUF1554 domain-containing protein [Leptospira alstonii]|uniref:PF07588 family protein n=2 Tax=Leptospira alstonii TaxID=28452 RepID=M6D0Y6_9LEPT|nr:DUF1554 domain-containing protein [Leptospira alstonii]EMJ96351.1 PF07588 family protein [Leptospira alstonii serovar Sichuan str. 79601]EQA81633.1 PF07588 family protein [Leptospira alstonii serovar Pingchang str. 80-412]
MIFKEVDFLQKIRSIGNGERTVFNSAKHIQKMTYSFLICVFFLTRCSTPFPDLNPNLLFLALLGSDKTEQTSDPNLELKYIFVTVAGTMGQLGAGTVAGADNICANEKNTNFVSLPGTGTDYKAMIASTGAPLRRACNATPNCTNRAENANWVLLPNQDYYKGAVSSPVKAFTTNSAGIVVFPVPGLLTSIDSNAATTWWTGVEADWTSSVNCLNWTSVAAGDNAQFGSGNALSDVSIADLFTSNCNVSRKLVCVRQ